ncbi:MAG TPA: cysteine desulfurase-like protein [Terriglobales bacterium]|nr:cysteine desulfurase-like protein [Terriglobales bacterium]
MPSESGLPLRPAPNEVAAGADGPTRNSPAGETTDACTSSGIGANLRQIRAQFPALTRTHGDLPYSYLDGPGGTQVPRRAIDAMAEYLGHSNANHEGAFATSEESDAILTEAHAAAADFLGASGADDVAFGQNMTTLTFSVSRAIGRTLRAGDEVVVTRLDHDANVAPWLALEEERGVVVRWVGIREEDCTLDLAGLERVLGPRTRLVAVGLASNAVGTINPVHRIVEMAHGVGAWTYIDAVHAAPHVAIDVAALDTDFLVCSPYKFFGPHLGLLYGKRERLEQLASYRVRPAPEVPPGKWETGTLPGESIAGLLGTFSYLEWLGSEFGSGGPAGGGADPDCTRRARFGSAMNAIHVVERDLALRAQHALSSVPGLKLRGIVEPARIDERVPTFAFTLAGSTPRQVALELGKRGIAAWDGDYYAYELIRALGLGKSGGMVRVGFVHYNEPDEIERLAQALWQISESAAPQSPYPG